MIIWRTIDATLATSMETLLINNVFTVLTSKTLMFPWSFVDDSMKTIYYNIDVNNEDFVGKFQDH